ncbi:hypothetical protein U9M48_023626 [Paspalum notatum var. saurae]|uniref:Uncharacterized protein n=1 Tax=Paspalum notatum var. saurae TaxID=547442 RepID=A0AAQ3TR00_PASNO
MSGDTLRWLLFPFSLIGEAKIWCKQTVGYRPPLRSIQLPTARERILRGSLGMLQSSGFLRAGLGYFRGMVATTLRSGPYTRSRSLSRPSLWRVVLPLDTIRGKKSSRQNPRESF